MYEDGRDAAKNLYLDLDLSNITIPTFENKMIEIEPNDEAAALTEEAIPTPTEVKPASVEGQEIEAAVLISVATKETKQ